MEALTIKKISKSAKKLLQERNVEDITFDLFECEVAGCCVGLAKEIRSSYQAPDNAAGYRYVEVDGYHVFISRRINILRPLTLTTEGIWKKRLFLSGANVPI